jgi:predicted O-methyltransferase YrrM
MDRYSLVELIKERNYKTSVEIGVGHGGYSYYILKNSDVERLYSVDPWDGSAEFRPGSYEETVKSLAEFGERSVIMKEVSGEAVNKIADDSIDFIYIDGDHSEAAVENDLRVWYPKMKKDGIISGHDIQLSGVEAAVKKFCEEKKFSFDRGEVEPTKPADEELHIGEGGGAHSFMIDLRKFNV